MCSLSALSLQKVNAIHFQAVCEDYYILLAA